MSFTLRSKGEGGQPGYLIHQEIASHFSTPSPPHTVLFSSQYLSGTMHESRAHIHAPYEGSRGIDIHPVDYQVRQCTTSADRGEDALADLEVDAKAPLQVVAEL